jgi:hypothetical protein
VGLLVQLLGAGLVLAAFALLQLHVLRADSRTYLVLNAVGSGVLAGNAAVGAQWGFVALNVTWCAVSLWGLARIGRAPDRG